MKLLFFVSFLPVYENLIMYWFFHIFYCCGFLLTCRTSFISIFDGFRWFLDIYVDIHLNESKRHIQNGRKCERSTKRLDISNALNLYSILDGCVGNTTMCTIRFQHFHFNCRGASLEFCQLHTWRVLFPNICSIFKFPTPTTKEFPNFGFNSSTGSRLKGSFRFCLKGRVLCFVWLVYVYVCVYRVAPSHTLDQVRGCVLVCVCA